MRRLSSVWTIAFLLALPLAACGKGDKDSDLNALDAQLTNDAVDPALNEALAGRIVVDPNHADRSSTARLPALKGEAAKALAESVKLAGGKLLPTPAPAKGEPKEAPDTLAAVVREQSQPGGNAYCRKQLASGAQWAGRLPGPFTVYPQAELKEAAGADKDGCSLRVATFVTPVPRQSVMDFYYTQARRAGYEAEHQLLNGDHVLGGTRKEDGSAFLAIFTAGPGGRTSVDIIADKGR